MSKGIPGLRHMTPDEQDAAVRARRVEYLMVDARKPDEEEFKCFGIPVSTMSKEELLAVIYKLHRENEMLRSRSYSIYCK